MPASAPASQPSGAEGAAEADQKASNSDKDTERGRRKDDTGQAKEGERQAGGDETNRVGPVIPLDVLRRWEQGDVEFQSEKPRQPEKAESGALPDEIASSAESVKSGSSDESTATTESAEPASPEAATSQAEPARPGSLDESASPITASLPAEEAKDKETSNKPQIEVYIPSITRLTQAARKSKTAPLLEAVIGMMPSPVDETGEGLDFAALQDLLTAVTSWPDTPIALTTYTQDSEGRPRWAARVRWPLDELRDRIEDLLSRDAAKQLLKDIELRQTAEGTWRLELEDFVLAVLVSEEDGSLIASNTELKPPKTIFGQPSGKQKGKKKGSLVYCRISLEGDGGDDDSPLARVPGVRDVSYGLSMSKDGCWQEKCVVVWNPLIGTFLKMAFQKSDKTFDCPTQAYVIAVFNVGGGSSMADSVAGLPPGTLGSHAGNETGFALAPGTGFLPLPDVFFQFEARKKDKIVEAVREAIEKDNKERKKDDRSVAWHEERIDEKPLFWFDPTTDQVRGFMPFTYRTVLFFDEPGGGEDEDGLRLIVAQTSTQAEDAVRNWMELTRGKGACVKLPDASTAHWQARVRWRKIYELAQPYLAVLAGVSVETSMPPTAAELSDALVDSNVNIRVLYAGIEIRHTGPIPIGAVAVPGAVAMSLGSSAASDSEAARERVACRHLRVLYHHAKLFKKDYGRWPATVAELDGYVDFATHSYLLDLRQQKRSFAERLAMSFVGERSKTGADEDEREKTIDDSLYEIEWSPADWKLKFRDDEFKAYVTIYIDQDGEIHRVRKDNTTDGNDDDSSTHRSDNEKVAAR